MSSKPYSTTGDRDPFTYGGGIVYVDDETGDATWVVFPHTEEDLPEPEEDDDGNMIPSNETTEVFSITVEPDIFGWHNWVTPEEIASSTGMDPDELREMSRSDNVMERVAVLEAIAGHWGHHELDHHADKMTLAELLAAYESDHAEALRPKKSNPRDPKKPSGRFALVRAFGVSDKVLSVHKDLAAAQKAMRKLGGEPDSLVTGGMRVVDLEAGHTELIQALEGGWTTRPIISMRRGNPVLTSARMTATAARLARGES